MRLCFLMAHTTLKKPTSDFHEKSTRVRSCIYIDDVTIHNTNLRIGWGVGTPEKHYLKEYSIIVKVLLKYRR